MERALQSLGLVAIMCQQWTHLKLDCFQPFSDSRSVTNVFGMPKFFACVTLPINPLRGSTTDHILCPILRGHLIEGEQCYLGDRGCETSRWILVVRITVSVGGSLLWGLLEGHDGVLSWCTGHGHVLHAQLLRLQLSIRCHIMSKEPCCLAHLWRSSGSCNPHIYLLKMCLLCVRLGKVPCTVSEVGRIPVCIHQESHVVPESALPTH